jgi:hypothetical protein
VSPPALLEAAVDWFDRHAPRDPRVLRILDFLLPALVTGLVVLNLVQVGNVTAIANDNSRNLEAQEDERTSRIYVTNSLDEYFCGQIEDVKGAIEGILNATLALPPKVAPTRQQLEVRAIISERLLKLESGGACKVRIPSPPKTAGSPR